MTKLLASTSLTALILGLSGAAHAQQAMTASLLISPPATFLAGEQDYLATVSNGIIVSNPMNNAALDSTGVVAVAHSLNYSEYGTWSQTKGADQLLGAFQTGTPTPISSIPSAGAATYTGGLAGQALVDGAQYRVTGNETINVNFAANTIGAGFTLNKQSLVSGAKSAFGSLNAAGSIRLSNGYWQSPTGGFGTIAGTLQGRPTTYGYVDGRFYGPAAQETGGTFQVEAAGIFAQAAFSAKAIHTK